MILGTLGSFLAALGFGVMFNIKGKKLIIAAIAGSIGYLVHQLLCTVGIDDNIALFLAAVAFTLYAEIYARIMKTPVTLFVVCALIVLVPGGSMYYTMLYILQGNTSLAVETGLGVLANAGSLSLGMILINAISNKLTAIYLSKTKS
ncbi:MAG: threonine/serine exporter family protein [Erysipelotrichaceae bacterium]|nr:threonine/serine exporter family protein [Erysipelotrichaceae bacterium]